MTTSLIYIIGGLILGVGALVLGVREIIALRGEGETISHTVRRLPKRSRWAVVGGCFLIAVFMVWLGFHLLSNP